MFGEKVYIPALMGASGITFKQAKTCFYYALATHFIPDKLNLMPILAIIGPQGTGKTSLMKQLAKLVNGPKDIAAESEPTLRDSFAKAITALIDEGDNVFERLLHRRYDKTISVMDHKVPRGANYWVTKHTDIFGATIIGRREPFKDAATTSRSIIIKTIYRSGKYRIRNFRKASACLSAFAEKIDLKLKSSQRIKDNWMPLQTIARYLKDDEWLDYSKKEIKGSTRY